VIGGRSLPGLEESHLFFVLLASLEDLIRRIPLSFGDFAEIPGMALAAGEVTARLIDGKIILRPG
jgi:hypothetical protein